MKHVFENKLVGSRVYPRMKVASIGSDHAAVGGILGTKCS